MIMKRQRVIGNYIVDFYCPAAKLVIEVDGSQHYEETGKRKDQQRDEDLEGLGLKVLRYSNYDVNHSFEAVCNDILHNLELRTNEMVKVESTD
jgi:very-short-patch-repair endonuclease